jgi:uncharacterized glyoxalase superfamily protein PhnB
MTDRIGVWPTLVYKDGPAAMRFLTEALGFEKVAEYPGEREGTIAHAELLWPAGGGAMLSSGPDPDNEFNVVADGASSVYLVSDDPDGLFERATAAGADVVRPLRDEDYGARGFTVRDQEGNFWSVGTFAGEA